MSAELTVKGNKTARIRGHPRVITFTFLLIAIVVLHRYLPQTENEVSKYSSSGNTNATTPTTERKTMGYTKTVIKEGNGQKPEKGQYVTVHCTGYGKNRDMNLKFWSTKDPGQQPFTFRVGMGEVIKAWDESVLTMSMGEQSRVVATPDYAYGAGGFPAWGIMPNSELAFEIEVLKYSYTAS